MLNRTITTDPFRKVGTSESTLSSTIRNSEQIKDITKLKKLLDNGAAASVSPSSGST
jgi:hypothetical protein